MSILLMSLVYKSDLPKNLKAIAVGYADHADDEGENIFPSMGYMSWKTGYAKRSVRRITRELIELNILIPDGKGPQKTNKFKMQTQYLPERPPYRKIKADMGEDTVAGGGGQSDRGGEDSLTPDPSLDPIYKKASGFNWLEQDVNGSMIDTQQVNSMVSALSAFCKGMPNQFDPDNCKFYQYASIFVSTGYTPEQIRPFEYWWTENGYYSGKPAVKSVSDHIDDFMAGRGSGLKQAEREWSEVLKWVDRKITFDELTNPATRSAFRAVGEQTLRNLNGAGSGRTQIKKQFMKEFNIAVVD